ncbi:MAG TPA: hypothetical protein VGH90_08110, partial [Chthoniobacteraceae bacterium]
MPASVPPEVRRFHAIGDRWLEGLEQLFPQDASELGFHEFDSMFGGNDAKTHLDHRRLLRETLEAVEALPDIAFAGDDWL